MQQQQVRRTLSAWAQSSWFLFADDLLFVSLFGVGAYIFSQSWPPLYLLSALSLIGSACMYAMYRDIESQITVVMLFFSSFVVSGVNYLAGALIMAIPVGLVVSLAVAGWMDRPNQQRVRQHPPQPAPEEKQQNFVEKRRPALYNKGIEGE